MQRVGFVIHGHIVCHQPASNICSIMEGLDQRSWRSDWNWVECSLLPQKKQNLLNYVFPTAVRGYLWALPDFYAHVFAVNVEVLIDSIDAPEGTTVETDEVLSVIKSLKKVFASKRADYVQRKAEENAQKLYDVTKNLFKLTTERRNLIVHGADISIDLLSKRQQDAIDMQNGIDSINGDSDSNSSEDHGYASFEILLGSSIAVKNAVCPIKLPEVERLPRYTTWIFLDRNQRMTEDKSVVGRRRIYYDQNSGEALICSDSEEELLEEKEEKMEFVESEDVMLCSTIQQVGLSDRVLDLLGQCLSRKPREVQARYEELVKDENACSSMNENIHGSLNLFLDKGLDAALDTFDILFCRRCLVFDCKSHGCSQDLIFTAGKQLPWYSPDVDKDSPDVDKEPCCPNCYRLAIKKESKAGLTPPQFANHVENPVRPSEINGDKPWRSLEKALFEKGLEMFGRSSCMIARNLMNGLRTCWEVFQYMENSENELSQVGGDVNGKLDCSLKGDAHTIMGDQPSKIFKFLHRRGRARRLKCSDKLVGYRAHRKRISGRKDLNRQYNPCSCEAPCGKECPCIVNRTCCEKYCGCPKSCKNRFRGCVCMKDDCRSMQCACFSVDRECDPDVCRNCWISCGDGTLGFPSQRGAKHECNNMKLLLKQHQKVLLGRSDVSGWGAFLKNSVEKNEFLGEYTGELISHDEADRRGKIYDLENSSFLFNLTNQFVLDANRKGNKLKFANHSPDPNCYPKVIKVAGDHKVGIFAKERIFAGEELFYDYGYDPDTTHAWARKPEASTTRK
ncbi:hypothetical protein HAX54_010132 [Datura stramonium]|uniref:[Histone H3]-lysine(27) N-trimethyltransferase n=1 Tax=Datura stramonium TaxID=4076 RepID=A0ABS8THM2_DATST|nr:hypothetical protein [Datura stramonium]